MKLSWIKNKRELSLHYKDYLQAIASIVLNRTRLSSRKESGSHSVQILSLLIVWPWTKLLGASSVSSVKWKNTSTNLIELLWGIMSHMYKVLRQCPATSKCSVLMGDYYYSSLFSPGAATHFHSAITLNMTLLKPNMSSLHKLASPSLFLRVQLFPATLLKTLKPCLTFCSSEYISKFPVSLSHWSFPFSFCYYTT